MFLLISVSSSSTEKLHSVPSAENQTNENYTCTLSTEQPHQTKKHPQKPTQKANRPPKHPPSHHHNIITGFIQGAKGSVEQEFPVLPTLGMLICNKNMFVLYIVATTEKIFHKFRMPFLTYWCILQSTVGNANSSCMSSQKSAFMGQLNHQPNLLCPICCHHHVKPTPFASDRAHQNLQV